jgi:hypothetical protein
VKSEKQLLDELVAAIMKQRQLRRRQTLLEALLERVEELDRKRDWPD